ncbi:MAG: hypothetical protein AAF799_43500 [Myxococcota bacterium]
MAEETIGSLLGVGLLALRWWALLSVQVLWRATVGWVWLVVAGVLAVVLASADGAVATAAVGVDPVLAAAAELMLGALLGLVVALPGYALLGAAQASATVLEARPASWRALTLSVVAATALSLGLHRPLLLGAQALTAAWPVGDPAAWLHASSQVSVARLAHGLALLALTLATPALLVGALAELVARVAGRGSLAGIGDAVGPWLRVAGALVATGASWAAYDAIWAARALGLDS